MSSTKGVIVPAGGGQHLEMGAPGRFAALKLLGLAGEITFQIGGEVSVGGPGTCAFLPRNIAHAWKNTGSETARVVFLYTPAVAGGYVEELLHRTRPMTDGERTELRDRYGWEFVGPNPL
jgi:glyoxylate utilization-related uncharacterized protein